VESTQLPTPVPAARPVSEDALCFELKRVEASLTVGRGTENQIVVNDLTVSREQLFLEFANQQWRLRTIGPVTVDGQPVGPEGALLKNGAAVAIGDVRMTFYEPEGFLGRLATESAKTSSPQAPAGPVAAVR
jgi:pSer/pThr/pTyr-binding forkhead associated (FHA) protein